MAIVPLRQRAPVEIESDDAAPDMNETRIVIDDDGGVEIEYGKPQASKGIGGKADDRFNRNLADDLEETGGQALAQYLIESIDADKEGRSEWEETANRGADYLGITLADPTSGASGDGTISQAVVTVMLEVAIRSWGTARAELLPVDGPVKVKRDDPLPTDGNAPDSEADAKGDNLADALQSDMNWYLTKGDRGYYPDFSKMLMHRPVVGMAFRKVYRCPIERKPISRWVMAQNLIVSGNPTHLDAASRKTEVILTSQSLMRRLQTNGHYRDIPLVHPTGDSTNTEITIGETQGTTPTPSLPRDYDHTVYECYCEIGSGTNHDLFGDLALLENDETGKKVGYPLPYRVSIDKDSQAILEIRRDWKKGDADHRARHHYVKYGYIPGFGFYDLGLIHIVGNPTQAATMIQRSVIDAGVFFNFPAWMQAQGPGSRSEATTFRPSFGEVVKIPVTAGSKLDDTIKAWPYKEPSSQSMAMLDKLENDVRKLAGMIDMPVGEGKIGNTPVGTIMSYLEAITQVPGAVHKDDHISQEREFDLLLALIAEEPEVLVRGNRNPARQWQVAQELLDQELTPKADPNTASQIHRLMKVQGLVTLGGLPQFATVANNRAIFRRAAQVLSGEDAEDFMMPEQPAGAPPPPDPKVLAAQIKAEGEARKGEQETQRDAQHHAETMAEMTLAAHQKEADRQSSETQAALKLAGTRTQVAAGVHKAEADRAHQATQGALDRIHKATQGHIDRTHQAGMQSADHAAQANQADQDTLGAAPAPVKTDGEAE